MEKSMRVSSNVTLLLVLFIPIFWTVFFGMMTLAMLLTDEYSLPFPTFPYIRFIILSIFLLFFFIMYNTIMRLKRIELSATSLYASNYFKTYRYTFQDIKSIKTIHFGLFDLVRVELKSKGKFGKRINFILNKAQLEYYLETNPESEFTLARDAQKDK